MRLLHFFSVFLGVLALFATALAADTAPAQGAATSIWPRLVAGMRLGGEDKPEVRRFIAQYGANPAYFTAMLARAEPFLAFVLHAAEQRSLPAELALLPAVESGWNAHAVSVSSAQGLWQFIPKTGDAFGLKNADNYDARRDPVASTFAAMKLLTELHQEFGDWPLALAAYNTGGVRLKQAMRASQSRNFWRLPLPSVTKDYVSRLLAIAALVRNPARYGVALPDIAEASPAEVIAIDADAPLHLALQAAGIDDAVLMAYNPALLRSGVPTQAPTLLLPAADALAVRAELAVSKLQVSPPSAAPVSAPRESAEAPLFGGIAGGMHWQQRLVAADADRSSKTFHEVRQGDTFFTIARQHGLSVPELKRINPRVAAATLQPGQRLQLSRDTRGS